MQFNSAIGHRVGSLPLATSRHLKTALLPHSRRLGGYICAHNEFHEAEWFAAANSEIKAHAKRKDPSRYVADTSDEEANLPENPIDLDEEMMIPQRPSISDLYKDVRHAWAEPDLTKSGKIVADTSDEESNLPGDPLDLDEEMMLPQKQIVKEIYAHLPGQKKKEICACNENKNNKAGAGGGSEVEVNPTPGSHEMPKVGVPKHDKRESKMCQAENDVTKMASKHDERIQGIFEGIDKIAEDENRHYFKKEEEEKHQQPPSCADNCSAPPPQQEPPPPSPPKPAPHSEDLHSVVVEDTNPSIEASHPGLEGGIEDQLAVVDAGQTRHQDRSQVEREEEETYEVDFSGDDEQIMMFSFKDKDKSKEENKKKPPPNAPPPSTSTTSERLRVVAAKAAAAGRELDPLTKLAAVSQAYREHRILTDESLHQTKPTVTMARILEVSAGRAALVGVFSAIGSEILLERRVLSQLLDRWDELRQVEPVISESRTLAVGVFALCLAITAMETLFSAAAPPAGKYFGFSPKQQIWVGRFAMFAFLVIVLYKTMHSNRPFPLWYLVR